MTVVSFEDHRRSIPRMERAPSEDPSYPEYWTYEPPEPGFWSAEVSLWQVVLTVAIPFALISALTFAAASWLFAQELSPGQTILSGLCITVPSISAICLHILVIARAGIINL